MYDRKRTVQVARARRRVNEYRRQDAGWPRDHESYIVRVPSGTKAKDNLYWPRVSALKLVE